jgi:hypothetical protein
MGQKKRRKTIEEAAKEMAELTDEYMRQEGLSPFQREKRIKAFEDAVATIIEKRRGH